MMHDFNNNRLNKGDKVVTTNTEGDLHLAEVYGKINSNGVLLVVKHKGRDIICSRRYNKIAKVGN